MQNTRNDSLVERSTELGELGVVRVIANDRALVAILFDDHRRAPSLAARVLGPRERHALLDCAVRELEEYVRGERSTFTVPRAPRGTAFQRAVWDALAAIPIGETRTYAAIARAVGSPAAVRAVGAANGRNPLSIVVPCHRVVGSDGTLTGYAGGVKRKAWLLAHEQRLRPCFRGSSSL